MWSRQKRHRNQRTSAAVILIMVLMMALFSGWFSPTVSVCAYAADNQDFIGSVYQDDKRTINVICTIPGETGGAENFTVMLGDTELPVRSVRLIGEEALPMTVYCLVDISGSMKGRMEQVKEILYTIADSLGEEDNFVLGRMGNEITDSAFLTERDDICAQIDSLQVTGEDTNFYSGLLHAIRLLQQGDKVKRLPVLVVISDGCDDNGNGATEKEADAAVRQADIPIYTAAIILDSDDYENAKKLGSFARNSAGGIHLPFAMENSSFPDAMTGGEMGEAMVAAMKSAFHVSSGFDGIEKTGKDTYVLSVTFRNAEGKICEDSREIKASDLIFAEPETSESETSEKETDPILVFPVPYPEHHDYVLYIISGLVCFLLIAVIFLILSDRLREAREKEEKIRRREEDNKLAKEEERRREEERLRREEAFHAEQEREEEQKRLEREIYDRLPRVSIRLAAVGMPDMVFYLELVQGYETGIGRSEKANLMLNADDTRLSGRHFVMLWDGADVYVWDDGSTNGTTVNGVRIDSLGRVILRPGDSLGAGSYKYRVSWKD